MKEPKIDFYAFKSDGALNLGGFYGIEGTGGCYKFVRSFGWIPYCPFANGTAKLLEIKGDF